MSRTCTRCKITKELSEFHCYRDKYKNGKMLYRFRCKVCINEISRNKRSNFSEEDKERERIYKRKYRATWSEEDRKQDSIKSKIRRKNNKEHYRFQSLKNRYGLSKEAYINLLKDQNNQCAICGLVIELMVDHDHKHGNVRGLLCKRCNTGLGMFNDDPVKLESAINYIRARRKPHEETS